jgi:hypothetical protein
MNQNTREWLKKNNTGKILFERNIHKKRYILDIRYKNDDFGCSAINTPNQD